MCIRVNWNQGKVASDFLVRAHQIVGRQPSVCGFLKMKGNFIDFANVNEAEHEIRNRGYGKYKRCRHCWDNTVRDLTP